jgi:hypothetical protein
MEPPSARDVYRWRDIPLVIKTKHANIVHNYQHNMIVSLQGGSDSDHDTGFTSTTRPAEDEVLITEKSSSLPKKDIKSTNVSKNAPVAASNHRAQPASEELLTTMEILDYYLDNRLMASSEYSRNCKKLEDTIYNRDPFYNKAHTRYMNRGNVEFTAEDFKVMTGFQLLTPADSGSEDLDSELEVSTVNV